MLKSVAPNTLIINFIKLKKIDLIYNTKIINHIVAILTAMALKGFTAKMTDIAENSGYHRTTISYFLSKYNWKEEPLKEIIKNESFQHIESIAKETGEPIFISIDDTVNCKTKPSSQALKPMQGTSFHHSHLLKKCVWGHQVQAIMINTGEVALNYDIHRYNKEEESKISYAQEQIKLLPVTQCKTYIMGDAWYTNHKIIDASISKGYDYIGALKTNRIIYPKGMHISIAKFAIEHLNINDFNLVTVKGREYYMYRYEGKLNKIGNAVVVISWPKDAFKNPKALKAFISTDTELESVVILEYYSKRWCIETFFAQQKGSLGFGKYQIRSVKGIERLWILMSLFHLMCTIGLDSTSPFGDGLRTLRKSINEDKISFVYQSAQKNIPLQAILDSCA